MRRVQGSKADLYLLPYMDADLPLLPHNYVLCLSEAQSAFRPSSIPFLTSIHKNAIPFEGFDLIYVTHQVTKAVKSGLKLTERIMRLVWIYN